MVSNFNTRNFGVESEIASLLQGSRKLAPLSLMSPGSWLSDLHINLPPPQPRTPLPIFLFSIVDVGRGSGSVCSSADGVVVTFYSVMLG